MSFYLARDFVSEVFAMTLAADTLLVSRFVNS